MDEKLKEHIKRLEPFKLEFLDEKDRYYQLDSSIEQIYDEYMIISPPKNNKGGYDLEVGAEVSIVFYRSDGILYGQCQVLGKQSGFKPKLKMTLPYNVNLIERRRARRYPLKMRMTVEYYFNKNSTRKKMLDVITQDVSLNGVSFVDPTPFGKFERIVCTIYPNLDHSEPIIATCQFVYSREKKMKGETMYLTALTFTEISKEDSFRLQEKCFRKAFS